MADKEMQQKILNICKESTEKNPIVIFNRIVKNEEVLIPVHGPIHHVVDGAAFMTAFFNAGEKSIWKKVFGNCVIEQKKCQAECVGIGEFVERLLL